MQRIKGTGNTVEREEKKSGEMADESVVEVGSKIICNNYFGAGSSASTQQRLISALDKRRYKRWARCDRLDAVCP